MKLILFDIDGTLLLTNGAGRRTMYRSLRGSLPVDVDVRGVSFAGRTDPQIMRDILASAGLSSQNLDARVRDALDAYADSLEETLVATEVEVLPGVPDLLQRLDEDPDVLLGLLTGNLKRTARLKLSMADLWDYFPIGAFGSDDPDRSRLATLAVQRAEAFVGLGFDGSSIAVVGDTGHDIRCGRTVGGVSVAVCTGVVDRETLLSHDPDVLLEDLSETDSFLDRIYGRRSRSTESG